MDATVLYQCYTIACKANGNGLPTLDNGMLLDDHGRLHLRQHQSGIPDEDVRGESQIYGVRKGAPGQKVLFARLVSYQEISAETGAEIPDAVLVLQRITGHPKFEKVEHDGGVVKLTAVSGVEEQVRCDWTDFAVVLRPGESVKYTFGMHGDGEKECWEVAALDNGKAVLRQC